MKDEEKNLTKSEEELMDLFWSNGGVLTSVDIMNTDREHSYKKGYIHIMLRSLQKKGMIEVCGMTQYNNKYARQFRPTMSMEEYIVKSIMSKCPDMKSVASVAVNMAKEADQKQKEALVKELKKIIEELDEDNEDNDGEKDGKYKE